jgi:hypothetical protein
MLMMAVVVGELGCDSNDSCSTLRGCGSALVIRFEPPISLLDGGGGFEVQLEHDSGTVICLTESTQDVFTGCGPTNVDTVVGDLEQSGGFVHKIDLYFAPKTLRVRVVRNGSVLRQATFTPTYSTFEENCRTCHFATVSLNDEVAQ